VYEPNAARREWTTTPNTARTHTAVLSAFHGWEAGRAWHQQKINLCTPEQFIKIPPELTKTGLRKHKPGLSPNGIAWCWKQIQTECGGGIGSVFQDCTQKFPVLIFAPPEGVAYEGFWTWHATTRALLFHRLLPEQADDVAGWKRESCVRLMAFLPKALMVASDYNEL